MNGRRTRERILDAARAELAVSGLVATSVRGVARRAGVDVRLVAYYFTSREQLLREALRFPRDQPPAGNGEENSQTDRTPGTRTELPSTGDRAAQLGGNLREMWRRDQLARRALVSSAMTDDTAASELTALLADIQRDPAWWREPPSTGDEERDRDPLVAAHLLGLVVLCESGVLRQLREQTGEFPCGAGDTLEDQLHVLIDHTAVTDAARAADTGEAGGPH